MKDTTDKFLEHSVALLREAGQPLITITLDDFLDLGQEFFRWEIATATAGAIWASTRSTNQCPGEQGQHEPLLAIVHAKGRLPEEKPSLVKNPLRLYFKQTPIRYQQLLKQFLVRPDRGII